MVKGGLNERTTKGVFKKSVRFLVPIIATVFLVGASNSSLAETGTTNVITTEATYIMGDGETPSFAEAMALQKAKQFALEQAGTYLQSMTVVKDQQLTTDEIQTLAGGIVKVEALGKKRVIVEEGVRVWVKIRATVDVDQVQALADRVKGKSVATDYKKLQDDYAQLAQDIEKLRQLVANASAAQDREVALEQIQEQQKKLARLHLREATLVQRIVSGETLAAKAEEQLTRRQQEQEFLNGLLQRILDRGHLLTIGEPTIETNLKQPQMVIVRVPVTVEPNPVMRDEILQLAKANGWETVKFLDLSSRMGIAIRPGTDLEVLAAFQRTLQSYSLMIKFVLREGERVCVDMTRFAFAVKGDIQGASLFEGRYGYAPVAGLISDLGRPKSEAKIAFLGISPAFGWSQKESVARAAVLRSIRGERDNTPGFMAIFDRGRRFNVNVAMPLDVAKTITAVRGEFRKNLDPPPPDLLAADSGVQPCIVVEDKK